MVFSRGFECLFCRVTFIASNKFVKWRTLALMTNYDVYGILCRGLLSVLIFGCDRDGERTIRCRKFDCSSRALCCSLHEYCFVHAVPIDGQCVLLNYYNREMSCCFWNKLVLFHCTNSTSISVVHEDRVRIPITCNAIVALLTKRPMIDR